MAVDVFSLAGKITVQYADAVKGLERVQSEAKETSESLDDVDDSAQRAGNSMEDSGGSAQRAGDGFTVWKGILSNLVSNVITALINKAAELGQAIGDLTKKAVGNFAEYEQLVGGVETLYKDSAGKLINYAENAYKTVQLSANDYMETATSFAASLLQGLGGDTAQAVELSNLAITDMADNANKMGTDMTMIQNAYQGFAKQNYTMLDNLKLGYGGTQEEMIRLINDSGILNEEISSLDGITFDQMIQAIHAVQTELGITGTSAEEAGTTIQGSWNSVKSLFENILTKVGSELAPVVMNFLTQLSEWMEGVDWDEFAGKIGDAFGGIIEWLGNIDFTKFFDGAINGFQTLIDVLATVVEWLINAVNWVSEHREMLANLIPIIASVVTGLMAFKIIQTITGMVQGITAAVSGLKTGLTALQSGTIVGLILTIITALITLWNTSEDFRNAVTNIINTIATILSTVGMWFYENVITPIVTFFTELWNTIVTIVTTVWETIQAIIIAIPTWIYDNIITPVVTFVTELWNTIVTIVTTIWDTIVSIFVGAATWVNDNIIQPVVNFVTGLWNTLTTIFTSIWDTVVSVFTNAANWVNSTIIQPIVNFFTGMWNTLTGVFSGIWNALTTGASQAWGAIQSIFSTVAGFFGDIFGSAWQAVKNVFSTGGRIFMGIVDGILSAFKSIVNTIIGGINRVVAIPFNGINAALNGLRSSSILGLKPFGWIGNIGVPQIPYLAEGGIAQSSTLAVVGEGNEDEAIAPISKLQGYISEAVNGENAGSRVLADRLETLIGFLYEILPKIADNMGYEIVTDDGAVIAHYAPMFDRELGRMAIRKGR